LTEGVRVEKADDSDEKFRLMPPKGKGGKGGKKKQPAKKSQQTAPTNQSASAGTAAVTSAPLRQPPRDRSSSESDRPPSPPRGSVLAGSDTSAELLDREMDEVGQQIEQGEKTRKELEERYLAATASLRSDKERLRRLLAVSDGTASIDTLAATPARGLPGDAPAHSAPTRSLAEVDDIRRQADGDAVRKQRDRRLASLLAMPLPDVGQQSVRTDVPRPVDADPPSRKKPKAAHGGDQSSTTAWIDAAGIHDDVFVTGRSHALPTQAAIEELAANFISKYLSFADTRPEYDRVPCEPGSEASASALVANLRIALHSSHPTAATIAWILRHCAAAAPSQIPGINGSLVGHLLHSWAMSADVALTRTAALGDRVDHLQLNEMLSRSTIDHLARVGTDPSVFIRHSIRKLQDKQNERSVKQSFLSAAAATAVPPVLPQPPTAQHPPPGLGFQSSPAPVPPMVGLPDQTYSQRLRRWIRYPRDALHMVIMSACMLCGQGSLPGSVGHRSDQCQATAAQRDQWVQQKIPVQ
jgi:hypothetical protein